MSDEGRQATTEPFSVVRKRIASHMVMSKATSPHVSMAVEIDLEGVAGARSRVQDQWRAREGFGLGFLPFVAWAVCRAIAEFPRVNATVEDNSLVVFPAVDLGVAVDLDFEGLVVPVVRGAVLLDVAGLARAIRRLSEAAKARRLSPDDVGGGTYTISNIGAAGTLFTTPIINQPQVAILSVDGVRKRPVVVEGAAGDELVIHPVGVIVQSFDHRAFDGAYSAAFLGRVRELLETTDWESLLP